MLNKAGITPAKLQEYMRQGWLMAGLPLDDMQNAWGSIAADYISEAAELENDEATDD